MNNCCFVGTISSELNVYKVGNNDALKFSLAVRKDAKRLKTEKYNVDFIQFQAFGVYANNIAEFCKKGSLVAITSYAKQCHKIVDNEPFYYPMFIVQKVMFLDKKDDTSTTPIVTLDTESDLDESDMPLII